MIVTYLLQELSADRPKGFARFGGTMRYYMHRARVSQSDWLTTLDYALSRGWVRETGQVDDAGKVYDWIM